MKKHRILLGSVLLVLSLGGLTPQFAQDAPKSPEKSDSAPGHPTLVGFLRTINTAEVLELSTYGAYSPWDTLLAHQQQYLNGWLAKVYAQGPDARFGSAPEVLPGWNLRLNVQTDGKGYVALLEDESDKDGYAAVADESGIIRESKYLR